MARIVETDNFNRDYEEEHFVNIPPMPEDQCRTIADIINKVTGPHSTRYWKVVPNNYELSKGFQP